MRLSPWGGRPVNPLRGEVALDLPGGVVRLRPTFAALVAAEEELGPLVRLVERAGNGEIRLGEIAALFWHCAETAEPRPEFEARLARAGLKALYPRFRALLLRIFEGS
ncbi:MAG: gene transfer agent family protein [Sphingomonadaceae bacterium]|uniref:gene transfer agent family protein n=1 Tax=Thermaurantiacus sp. TaxID=2820283 RepID=UPI00298EE652|nr:gene transfer agent family protein [Thermaurantiacus sp.]MCS6987769.1 gene transfer agent family protein [Sphingomonadaceae bacterium]MDW8415010.1 gene transfer agent family protein [Thermaurantiacus sp.]